MTATENLEESDTGLIDKRDRAEIIRILWRFGSSWGLSFVSLIYQILNDLYCVLRNSTLTRGILSGVREIGSQSYLQNDVAILPGSEWIKKTV